MNLLYITNAPLRCICYYTKNISVNTYTTAAVDELHTPQSTTKTSSEMVWYISSVITRPIALQDKK